MCHWTAAKRVLRYLKGTKDMGITYSQPDPKDSDSQNHIVGYSDASFANNYDRTSVSGYAFVAAKGQSLGDPKSRI